MDVLDTLDELNVTSPTSRAQLKRAIFDERDRFFGGRTLTELELDLDEMLKMELAEERPVTPPPPSALQPPPETKNVVLRSTARKNVQPTTKTVLPPMKKIENVLGQVSVTFSQIFQALLVVADNPVGPLLVADEERLSKRSKAFAIRLNRIVFELKQKVIAARAAMLKLNVRPSDLDRQRASDVKLYQALRVALIALKAYLAHLPLVGSAGGGGADQGLYPRPLQEALSKLADLAILARELGYEASEFQTDVKRLEVAIERSRRNMAETGAKGAQKLQKMTSSKDVTDLEKQNQKTIAMINNLARERFGVRLSPKKTNLVQKQQQQQQKVILPGGNKLLEARVAAARVKRFGAKQLNSNEDILADEAAAAAPTHDNSNHTQSEDLASLRHDEDGDADDFSNIDRADRRSHATNSLVPAADPANAAAARVAAASLAQKKVVCSYQLELADDELSHILQFRRKFSPASAAEETEVLKGTDFFLHTLPSSFDSVRVISNVSVEIVDTIVEGVCQEILAINEEALVGELMNLEMADPV